MHVQILAFFLIYTTCIITQDNQHILKWHAASLRLARIYSETPVNCPYDVNCA